MKEQAAIRTALAVITLVVEFGAAILGAGVLFLWNAMFMNDALVDVSVFPWWKEAFLRFAVSLVPITVFLAATFSVNRWLLGPRLRWTTRRSTRLALGSTGILLLGSSAGSAFFGALHPHF
jgi:hypothetical protein